MGRILITTGNGMFGRAVANELADKGLNLRVMVRDRSKCTVSGPRVEIVTGDMDQPETLIPVMDGVDKVFLSSPMGPEIALRETAVIDAAKAAGASHLIKIHGAVNHEGDDLNRMHMKVIGHMKESGLDWTLVSPSSVMETSFLPSVQSVRFNRGLYGFSGHGRVGFVSLKNVAEAAAQVMTGHGHNGMNYEITGPEAIDMFHVAGSFTRALKRRVDYIDMTEDRFAAMLLKFDKTLTPEKLDIEILCHLRAWKEGRADLVTGTYKKLTGLEPMSMDAWVSENRKLFGERMLPMFLARIMRLIF